MRIVIVDTYYPDFIDGFYARQAGVGDESYDEQWHKLMTECFGTSDFYSRNLRALGHEATEIVANCAPLQRRWVRENANRTWQLREPLNALRRIPRVWNRRWAKWQEDVLVAQVRALRPDVIHIQDMPGTSPALLRRLRPYVRAITGQIACEYSADADFGEYDLVLSSFPHFVRRFCDIGWRSAYFQLGFEPSIRERLESRMAHEVVFIGSVSREHSARIHFLETIARRVPLAWWGTGIENLQADSPLRRCNRGQAWGIEMYQILSQSRITLNFHVDVAGPYANNMRLYEATGAGSMLLTDAKRNLHDIFEPGREVAVFDSPEQCVHLVEHYLTNESERASVAAAGLNRTMSEHTYLHRMREYARLVEPLLSGQGEFANANRRSALRFQRS